MENSIDEDIMIAPDMVLLELKRKEDSLYEWAKNQEKLFVPLSPEIQEIHTDIINAYPKLDPIRKVFFFENHLISVVLRDILCYNLT